MSVEIPLLGEYVWEPAPATDLRNMFFNVLLMEIEICLVQWNVKAGEAGKPSTRIRIDNLVGLEIVEQYSCVDVGHVEVFAEGRPEPLRMTSASSVLISDGDVKADFTMSPKN